jgi:hypothetical protein
VRINYRLETWEVTRAEREQFDLQISHEMFRLSVVVNSAVRRAIITPKWWREVECEQMTSVAGEVEFWAPQLAKREVFGLIKPWRTRDFRPRTTTTLLDSPPDEFCVTFCFVLFCRLFDAFFANKKNCENTQRTEKSHMSRPNYDIQSSARCLA